MSYRKSFQDCRMFGHVWYPTTVVRHPKGSGIEQNMVCKRCEARKKFVLDSRGNQVRSQYTYDVGYHMPGHAPHEVRVDFRKKHYGL